MKRLLSLLLALALLIGMIPVQANAKTLDNGLVYMVYADHVEITDYDVYSSDVTEVVIPAEIEGKPVTVIGPSAFEDHSSPTSIVIPDSVTTIGDRAFYWCTGLTSIVIPEKVTSIPDYAFCGCSSLTSIDLPDGITSIGSYAFRHCYSLTDVDLPDSVTFIGGYAFEYCESLTSIVIPANVSSMESYVFISCSGLTGIYVDENNQHFSNDDQGVLFNHDKTKLIQAPGAIAGVYTIPEGVTHIGDSAFYRCNDLTGINFPDSVTTIGYSAFRYCYGITSIDLSDSVTTIKDSAFLGCDSLTSITIPENITSINHEVFYNCSSLTSIEIPEGVTSIGNSAFRYCSSLTSIEISDRITSIGSFAFDSCTSLTGIYVDENNRYFSSDDRGVLFDYGKTKLIQAPGAIAGDYTVPESVNHINTRAFYWCTGLTSVRFVGNKPVIAGDAFSGTTVTAYCPADNDTWNNSDRQNYGGSITWVLYDSEHTYEHTGAVTAPTCTEQGYTTYTCACGASCVSDYVDALGHIYIKGVCIRCSEADPNYEEGPNTTDPGNGMFAPDEELTRGMFFYALWNFYGSPEPESTENPFMDVSESDYYFDAVCWAVETGIAAGASPTQFGPDIHVNRAQAATWLWRAAGSPDVPDLNPFTDVKEDDFFYKGVLWAIGNGFMHWSTEYVDDFGYFDGRHFGPYDPCFYHDISWTPGTHPHRYAADVTAPTCTSQGFTTYTCVYCEHSFVATLVDALGHDFTGRSCTRCGEADPAFWDPGNGMFAPNEVLTRGMFFYALWNFYGSPEPVATDLIDDTFTDISESDYYFDAVCWAVENGISAGASPTQFGANLSVLRAPAAYWLWRAAGSPESTTIYNPFTDVNETDYFCEAVLWATAEGLCMGPMNATHFDPHGECLYGHINWIPADHTHNFFDTVTFTAPTCTEQGYTTFTCHCGHSYAANYEDALGHDYKDGVCTACGEADPDYEAPEEPPFGDVPVGEWYYEPVNWAVEKGITNGTSENSFSPNDQCLRAHVVTFLWRANGCPEPINTDNSFTDVKEGDFFYDAVLWAVEKGITNGTSDTTFGSYDVCNRAQVVTFLHRAMESPAPGSTELPFTDVSADAWYAAPVAWAVENGITNGLSDTEFGPNAACNRAQVVTFLYRAYNG